MIPWMYMVHVLLISYKILQIASVVKKMARLAGKPITVFLGVKVLAHAFVFQVKGCVMDSDGNVRWVVSGMWDNKIDIAPVISTERASPDNPVFKTGPYTTAWKRKNPA
jgi:hypothetical protein